MKEFSYVDVEAATNGFSLERLIGKGSHGCVYKGTLKVSPPHVVVAVKKPSLGLQLLNETSKLDNEIAVLSSIKSSNVVNLLGFSRHPSTDEKLMIMELMPNGSLHDLLHSSPAPLTWRRRAIIALHVALAVRSLHESDPPVVHRDVKPANILFDRRRNARLADFSLAVAASAGEPPPAPAGTIGYMDPCYTAPERLSPANDVYGFGVVLMELVSGRRAMDPELETPSVVEWAAPLIEEGRIGDVCDRTVAAGADVASVLGLAARCVSRREEERPGMGEVAAELARVVEDLERQRMSGRVDACVRVWRKWVRKRVATTRRIVVVNHLTDGGGDDGRDEDERWGSIQKWC